MAQSPVARERRQRQATAMRAIPIAALTFLVMFKFQNCAPASQYSHSAAGQEQIVDNWSPSPVAFSTSSSVVPASTPQAGTTVSASTSLQGLCVGDANGTSINWSLTSVTNPNQIINSGQVTCSGGEFQLPLSDLTFQSCSDRYEVHAALSTDSSQAALTILEPDCT